MLRINPIRDKLTVKYVIKRLIHSKSNTIQSTSEKVNEQKYNNRKYEYQQSAFVPIIIGLSSITLLGTGLTYCCSDDFRNILAPYLPKRTKQLLDGYLATDAGNVFDRIRKNWDNLQIFDKLSIKRNKLESLSGRTKGTKESIGSESNQKESRTFMNEPVKKTPRSPAEKIKDDVEKEAERLKKLNEVFSSKVTHQIDLVEAASTSVILHLMEYANKIQEHSQKMKRAIEDDGTTITNPWEEVNESNHLQQTAKTKSDKEIKRLDAAVKQLEIYINEGTHSEDLKSNPSIHNGQEVLSSTSYRIKQKLADIEKAQFNAQITNQYKELIHQGQERFKQELSSLNPNVSNWTKKQTDKLSNEDLNAMIVHAHRRMHQLQARIAELESMEVIRLDAALMEQRRKDEKSAEEKVEMELERERTKKSLEMQAELDQMKQQQEVELRRALTRQASAHNEHINQLLKIQKDEIDKQHSLAVREALLKEREKMRASIDGWRMRVEGIEAAVEGRADEEILSREAQDMWVACHALHGVLTGNGATPPLARYLNSFEEAAQPASKPVLRLFLESIPKCALEEGVCTEHLLTKRFDKIKRICRRVAMIDETSASLPMYIISWIRSLVILTPSHLIESDTEIDPESTEVDTNQIIASAELAIWRQDFDLAVRLLNLLKGMPRVIVHDWINDARIYLETKLAADALSSYTSSKTAGSIPPLATMPLES